VPPQCLKGLRELCDKHGALLIYDEVQCGASRTGKLFAHQWVEGAEPDIMAVAKGVGGGFPMGACLATEKAGAAMVVGTHGTTFGGNPLAMAVGLACIEELADPAFLAHVNHVSNVLTQGLEGLRQRHPDLVVDIRGKGLLRGLKLTHAPKPVQAAARQAGLLVGVAGDNVVRLAPPLVITEADVRECVGILDATLPAARAS
jgi:acetylornithine/N-succinyldiaminopimelate aminotransferase